MMLQRIFGHFQLLRQRTYSIYFAGQLISMTGTFMQATVQAWLVYRLSGSAAWLGIIAFLTYLPAFILSPIAGVLVDHYDRRLLLIATQVIALLQAALLGFLALTNQVEVWHIAALATLNGMINAFELVSRHSFAVQMVGKEDLPSAIALNAFIINAAKIIGPSLGGILVAYLNEGTCFLINSASYIAVIYSLCLFSSQHEVKKEQIQILKNLAEGVRYVLRHQKLHFPLVFAAFIGVVSAPYVTLLPVFAKDVLSGDARSLGFLTGMHALGALIGALTSIGRGRLSEIRPLLIGRLILVGLGLSIYALSNHLWISGVAIAVVGYFLISSYPLINTYLQDQVDDRMRGRVISLYSMTFLGTIPFGGIISGWIAEWMSAQKFLLWNAILIGIVGIILSIRLWRKKRSLQLS